MKRLDKEQVKAKLESLSKQWRVKNGRLKLDLTIKDFQSVISLVNQIAEIAEEEDRHPDLKIHSYKKLEITIYTHDISGLSELDFKLAKRIDELVGK